MLTSSASPSSSRSTVRFLVSCFLLCRSIRAEDWESNNITDGKTDENSFCGNIQCHSGGECVGLDLLRPCQCPVGFGGIRCEERCEYLQEGPNCEEWRVNTPLCRDRTCDEVGLIESKSIGANATLVSYTVVWGDEAELEEIPFANDQNTVTLSFNVMLYFRIQCSNIECKNQGRCSFQMNEAQEVEFICDCPENTSGASCQHVAECSIPCQNGGECHIRNGLQYCACPRNFFGEACEFECTLNCQNKGQCIYISPAGNGTAISGEQICQCPFRFEGELCETERSCERNCQNGGTCVLSAKSDLREEEFLELCFEEYNGDCPEGFFAETLELCECPPEWTGENCTELCPCQNGGSCFRRGYHRKMDEEWDDDKEWNQEEDVESNNHYSCVCPNGYYGHDCQYENAVAECSLECRNGGYCSTKPNKNSTVFKNATDIQFCVCQEGFSGDLCEDSCSLTCQHGGVCTSNQVSVQGGGANRLLQGGGASTGNERCECGVDFFGDLCERKACGSGYCANGATCIVLPSGQLAPDGEDYVCDCSTVLLNDFYAAGKHCESMGISNCNSGDDNPNEPWFCTNSGRCFLNESQEYQCSCDASNDGPRCEYLAEEYTAWRNCELTCENNGRCLKGVVKPIAKMFYPFLEATKSSNLFNYAPTEDFEYCYCPPGSFGVRCEKQYELCEGGEHICFHGSTCQIGADNAWECDCRGVSAAGMYCQHEATEICNDQDVSKFCSNNGTCSISADKM
eukprot:scaffold22681_cov146-Cylindrotheca_fusiformis.AAC.1